MEFGICVTTKLTDVDYVGHCERLGFDVAAVVLTSPLSLLDTGTPSLTTVYGISRDGRYVLVWANGGGTRLRVDRMTGTRRVLDARPIVMSGDGQVVAGQNIVGGLSTGVRWENLATGEVKTLSVPGRAGGFSQEYGSPTGISNDGNVVVFSITNTADASIQVWAIDARNGNALNPAGFGLGTQFASYDGTVSSNGRYLAWSERRGVPAGCTLGAQCGEIWRYDLQTATRSVVSTNAAGEEGDRIDSMPQLSSDGRYLTWTSNSTNLLPDVADGTRHQFWKDVVSGEVRLVGDSNVYRSGYPNYGHHSISDNGQRVAWEGLGSNTLGTSGPPATTIKVKDMGTGSVLDASAGGNDGYSWQAYLSGDGRILAFSSNAVGLVAGAPLLTVSVFIAMLDAPGTPGTTPPPPAPPPYPVGSLPTLAGDIPVVGDWDGNGTDTIGVFRDGVWLLRDTNTGGGVDRTIPWGAPGDLPVVGDWDGDGTDTIGVYRNGVWYLRNTNTPGGVDATLPWGGARDIPVVGDWDGNGTDTIGVYRTGTWLLRDSNTPGPVDRTITWGGAADIPVVGDWDGNGTDTIGVYRTGTWLLRDSNTPGPIERAIPWGGATDIPLPGAWGGAAQSGLGVRRIGDWLLRDTPLPGPIERVIPWGGATFIR